MGFFTGSDGSFGSGIGNTMFGSGQNGAWNSTAFPSSMGIGNTFGTNGGGMIVQGGPNTWYANGKTYTRIGNMICCSDGRSFSGMNLTNADIMNIISHNG